jgi:hypothetical protein
MIGINTEMYPDSYDNNTKAFSYLSTIKSLYESEQGLEFEPIIETLIYKAEKENIYIRYGWINHEHEYFLATKNDAYDEIAYLQYDCEG